MRLACQKCGEDFSPCLPWEVPKYYYYTCHGVMHTSWGFDQDGEITAEECGPVVWLVSIDSTQASLPKFLPTFRTPPTGPSA